MDNEGFRIGNIFVIFQEIDTSLQRYISNDNEDNIDVLNILLAKYNSKFFTAICFVNVECPKNGGVATKYNQYLPQNITGLSEKQSLALQNL